MVVGLLGRAAGESTKIAMPPKYLGGAWRSLERWATKKPQSINLWGFSWHSLELCACILVGSTGTGVFC